MESKVKKRGRARPDSKPLRKLDESAKKKAKQEDEDLIEVDSDVEVVESEVEDEVKGDEEEKLEIQELEIEHEQEVADEEDDEEEEVKKKKKKSRAKKQASGFNSGMGWVDRAILIDPNMECPLVEEFFSPVVGEIVRESFGIQSLLPTQATVIPLLNRISHQDICVCAPTGSGKTLSYLLPLVERLKSRNVPRLRALIVLPTKDLSIQVFGVLEPFVAKLGLCAELCTGQTSFLDEQQRLKSKPVDILISTPGRLVDHIASSGLDLTQVEFLIIDEADQLLAGTYQDWVTKVLDAIFSGGRKSSMFANAFDSSVSSVQDDNDEEVDFASAELGRRLQKIRFQRSRNQRSFRSLLKTKYTTPLQKLLFSATLTTDPQKLANLGLINPVFVTASAEKPFSIPKGLKEYVSIVESQLKPLELYALLKTSLLKKQDCKVLVFTASVEGAHRLTKLLQILDPELKLAEFSRNLDLTMRKKLVDRFKRRSTDPDLSDNAIILDVIIASDAIARGVDFPGLDAVINYDCPAFTETYVHRAGRTSRAGREGECYTLLHSHQLGRFKSMLESKIEGSRLLELQVNSKAQKLIEQKKSAYEDALKILEHQILK
jgi:ATP-dependent RNA helicase DDX51/DBP6